MKACLMTVAAGLLALPLSACVSSEVLETAGSSSRPETLAEAPPTTDIDGDTAYTVETEASAVEAAAALTASTAPLPGVVDVLESVEAEPQTQTQSQSQSPTQPTTQTLDAESRSLELAALPPSPEGRTPDDQAGIEYRPAPRTKKVYLINGLVSAVPFIGYGFANLKRKIPGAKLYSYLTPVEGSVAVLPAVIADAQKAHKADPNVSINLIGISYGADLVAAIAANLHKKGIPVNYLGIVDGTTPAPIQPNVRLADNFTCTFLDCIRGRARLAKGNETTVLTARKFASAHIALGNNDKLHARVIAQTNSY